MAETKTCPKCNGVMTQGRIMRLNEYAARNQYLYVFAPDADSNPDLSKMFSGKPMSKGRKALVAFACEQCGFTEFYSQTIG
jgi:predicted nucleic-acid-binding Zn-ribbon protein